VHTAFSVNHRVTSEALRAQAIAEVTAQRWTHLFYSLLPPDDIRPLGCDEALSLLFDDARVLSISQKTYGPTSLIARLEHCRVGATIEPGIAHLCVSAHSADVARNVARAFGDPVLAPRPPDSDLVELAVWAKEK